MSFEIRTMTGAELDFAIDLAAAEGWNPGLHDADAFYAADPIRSALASIQRISPFFARNR